MYIASSYFKVFGNSNMRITVNDQSLEVEDGLSAARLIDLLGLSGKRVAMEINLEILPRSRFETHRLRSGDRIEIVHAIGGG
jgi:sulfur carrier protein